MEPFPKRQRLFSHNQRDFPQSYANQLEYYDESELEGEEGEEDIAPIFDPDAELQQRRARLDYKLKGTFEAIFEKYGRDFEGIGDEIDLATGDIVVNNGHLVEMLDERDAGLRNPRRLAMEDSEETTTSMEDDESLEDEDEDDENDVEGTDEDEDEEEEERTSGDDMDEDDLILRGFAQANRFIQASPELGVSNESYIRPAVPGLDPVPRRNLQSSVLPSHSNILAQFGPQLGPQIVEYIAQQERIPNDTHIEPAWRVPELPSAAPRIRSVPKYVAPLPEVERSPSPEASASVWAVARPRGRRRRDGRIGKDSGAIFRGETAGSDLYSRLPNPMDYRGVVELDSLAMPIQPNKKRVVYTDEDDEIMLDWVAKARKRGTRLWSNILWKGLGAKYPHHRWHSWRARYKSKFAYLWSNMESDLSASETTTEDGQFLDPQNLNRRVEDNPYPLSGVGVAARPSRVRKPAQKDSRIISWSEAVNTIASLDPDLHAGILDDARRANNGEASWNLECPAVSAARHIDPHRQSLNRPASSHQRGQSRPSLQSHQPSARRYSDHAPAPKMSSQSFNSTKLGSAPCPHADCRQYAESMYRLKRRDDEDVSQMTLHLLRAHNTTPFPCGELNCQKKGGKGYFLQEDLVTHVKFAHPYISALQRLRGRVDPILLNRNSEQAHRDIPRSAPPVNRPEGRQRDEDFMSAHQSNQAHASSDILSSTPEHDRTLTPSGFGRTTAGASACTPLTSVSSLKVKHSSATLPRREVSDSQERSDPVVAGEESWQKTQPLGPRGMEPSFQPRRVTSSGKARSLSERYGNDEISRRAPSGLSDHNLGSHSQVNNRPVVTEQLHRSDKPFQRVTNGTMASPQPPQQNQPSANQNSSPRSVPSSSTTIPNSGSFADQSFNSSLPSTQKGSGSKSSRPRESFFRNTIDPSHQFSDEEEGTSLPKYAAPPSIMLPPKTIPLPKEPITPATKRKAPKPVAQRALIQDSDLDELSLGADDFSIISSHSRTIPLASFGSQPRIKREGTIGPRMSSVAPSKKRKLCDLQGSDEIDELADEIFGKSTGPQTRIKREVDLNGTPMVHRVKAKWKEVKRARRDGEVANLPSQVGSYAMTNNNIVAGTSTPLLDLTPDRARGIHDSAESATSNPDRRTQRAAGISSPLDNLLTPARHKLWSGDMAKGTTIVVKTPGGTYRRCGDGGFRCGRSFCFRCGSGEVVVGS